MATLARFYLLILFHFDIVSSKVFLTLEFHGAMHPKFYPLCAHMMHAVELNIESDYRILTMTH